MESIKSILVRGIASHQCLKGPFSSTFKSESITLENTHGRRSVGGT